MKNTKAKTKRKATTTSTRLNTLLETLPASKIQELLDFGDFLVARHQAPRSVQKLGDRFAGVWKDDRTAEEIIIEIRDNKMVPTVQFSSCVFQGALLSCLQYILQRVMVT